MHGTMNIKKILLYTHIILFSFRMRFLILQTARERNIGLQRRVQDIEIWLWETNT